MTNLEMVAAELEAAKKKHPHFVDKITWWDADYARTALCANRAALANSIQSHRTTLGDVLRCELHEAIDAYAHGDLAHAVQELAQCASVCIRAMEEVQKEMEEKKWVST